MKLRTHDAMLAGLCALALMLASCQRTPRDATATAQTTTATEVIRPRRGDETPHLVRVSVTISRRADLRVRVGQHIAEGEVLSDRSEERAQLQAQRRLVELSLSKVTNRGRGETSILQLPPSSFDEAAARIRRAETAASLVAQRVEVQRQRLAEISRLPNLPAAVESHERARLAQLEREQRSAAAETELARAQMQTARGARSQAEFENAVRVRNEQTAEANRRRDEETGAAQLRAQLASIDERLRLVAVVRAPFSGTIQRVEWKGQTNNEITIELHIVVDAVGDGDTGADSNE